jgi:hypothetical protein
MAIDDCSHTFLELAQHQLPELMHQLREKMDAPISMIEFTTQGVGIRALAKRFKRENDFKGAYVLIEKNRPFYVGVSQTVLQRLRQQIIGITHLDASLAYRIASDQIRHSMSPSDAMATESFLLYFEEAKKYLQSLSFACIEIENQLLRYLFEPYCAMELDTYEWNTFETH